MSLSSDSAADRNYWNELLDKYASAPPATPEEVQRLCEIYGLAFDISSTTVTGEGMYTIGPNRIGFYRHRPLDLIIDWLKFRRLI